MQNITDSPYVSFADGEVFLTEAGRDLVKRGGADGIDDDAMLILEIIGKLDGVSPADLQTMFISLREQCGDDARYALKNGHVSFDKRVQ